MRAPLLSAATSPQSDTAGDIPFMRMPVTTTAWTTLHNECDFGFRLETLLIIILSRYFQVTSKCVMCYSMYLLFSVRCSFIKPRPALPPASGTTTSQCRANVNCLRVFSYVLCSDWDLGSCMAL